MLSPLIEAALLLHGRHRIKDCPARPVMPAPGTLFPGIMLLGIMFLWIILVSPVSARIVVDQEPIEDAGAELAYQIMADRWLAGDAEGVAALVHDDGLNVTSGPNAGRRTQYSPAQAVYYFKNLFQSHQTVSFIFDKVQGGVDSPRAHGMATWDRRRAGQDRDQTIRLMCVLARVGDGWKLTEIHTIR